MSRPNGHIWSGRAGKGAKALHRARKREEAEERNARTLPENRRAYRERRDQIRQRVEEVMVRDAALLDRLA